MQKNKAYIYAAYKIKRCTEAESKQMEKVLHAIGKKEKAGVVILMSDKIEFKDYHKRQRKT